MDFSFLMAYALVIIALLFAYRLNLQIEKTIFYSSIRAFIQLMTLGIVLAFILDSEETWIIPLILLGMLSFAARVAKSRCPLEAKSYRIPFLTLGMTLIFILIPLISLNILHPIPREIIPIGGMIIGNSLNAYTISVERFKSELQNTLQEFEARLALGEAYESAIMYVRRKAIKAGIIPIVNTLKTVGAVFIPGVMTGMILAGADPFMAASYQLVIVYMLAAAATLSAMFGTWMASTYILSTPPTSPKSGNKT